MMAVGVDQTELARRDLVVRPVHLDVHAGVGGATLLETEERAGGRAKIENVANHN